MGMKYTFSNVKEISPWEDVVGNDTVYIAGVPWTIEVGRSLMNGVEWFGLDCVCQEEDKSNWSRTAEVMFTLFSSKAGEEVSRGVRTKKTFTKENYFWGYDRFIKWSKLIDESNGFLSPNGDIFLELEIKVDPVLDG